MLVLERERAARGAQHLVFRHVVEAHVAGERRIQVAELALRAARRALSCRQASASYRLRARCSSSTDADLETPARIVRVVRREKPALAPVSRAGTSRMAAKGSACRGT
jgi:hypothetical protein